MTSPRDHTAQSSSRPGLTRAVLMALMLGVAACSGEQAATEQPRTVLVAQPSGGIAGSEAFAGEVRAREETALSFRVGGNLVRRDVDAGDQVRRGQVLAVLDSGDLRLQAQAAQAQAAAAQAELERASADRARYAALAKDQLVSRSALDAQDTALRAAQGQARAARAQYDVARNQAGYSELRAPRDGVVASRSVEAGQVVAAGQPVFTLAAEGGREVAIAIPENRYRDVAVGDRAQIELWSAPGERLGGRIREIAPVADAQARTYAARVAIDGASAERVDLGQSARVFLQPRGDGKPSFSLPLAAIQRGGNGAASVWVVGADGRLRSRPVSIGAFGSDSVPVLAGLRADDWVVIAGGHLLREGQAVAPVDRENRRPGIAPAATASAPAKP